LIVKKIGVTLETLPKKHERVISDFLSLQSWINIVAKQMNHQWAFLCQTTYWEVNFFIKKIIAVLRLKKF